MARKIRSKNVGTKDISLSKISKRHSKLTKKVGKEVVVNNPRVLKTVKAKEELVDKKNMVNIHDREPKLIALDVFSALNVTVVDISQMSKEFSLNDLKNKYKLLDNKNIINPDLTTKKNKKQDALKTFPNRTGSFYELDDGRADFQKRDAREMKKIETIDMSTMVADIYDLNRNGNQKSKLKLRQFSNNRR